VEKPDREDVLDDFVNSDDTTSPYLGSMGIYLFQAKALEALLDSSHLDFGAHLLPAALPSHRVYSYRFDGYWEDIGSIRTFYDTNLALAQPDPPFCFHDAAQPIYTRPRLLPGCRIRDVQLNRVLLADGCVIENAEIRNSLVGNRSIIGEGTIIEDSVLMGADYYGNTTVQSGPNVGIGPGSRIKGALIDKNARIGPRVRIEPFPPGTDRDAEHWTIRDGIVVIPKNGVLPADTTILPS
jgi:glucose-1-phosphate adenylyltransferase